MSFSNKIKTSKGWWTMYDYEHQAWIEGKEGMDGRYLDCCHPRNMDCKCYGRLHAGEIIKDS